MKLRNLFFKRFFKTVKKVVTAVKTTVKKVATKITGGKTLREKYLEFKAKTIEKIRKVSMLF